MVRRCAQITFCLVLGLFVIRQPENAADTVQSIGHGLALMADALSAFVSAL